MTERAYDIFKNLPILETHRLRLRKLSMRDAGDVFAYASVPEVAEHVTWEYHRNISDSMHYLRFITQQYQDGIPSPWGIIHKELGKLIGTIGYHVWSLPNGFGEVGYALSKDFWNKGYTTEAFEEVIRFGFERLRLNRVEATCKLANTASERVMLKCGLSYEGILRKRLFAKSEYHDLKLYSLLRKEWEQIQLEKIK
ncbi:MAG TPA: GNAT family protein [Ignavibacteria bacterium]|nr:GNAT family protein [Ignavibacteria bacterium]HMQ98640.1 GNAT family protein [Ignavibacteria bacterium]